jgi:phytoene desaturase
MERTSFTASTGGQSMSTQAGAPVVIIGAGIGGLSAAISLASAAQTRGSSEQATYGPGTPVIMLEKNLQVGGKMGQVEQDGFRWDTGPSVITMRPVFEALFQRAGRSFGDYVQLKPVEPLTRYFYPDGTVFDATANWPEMAAAIEALAPEDISGYLRFLAFASDLHRITGPVFIYDQPPTWRSFTRVPLPDMIRTRPWATMSQAIAEYVKSPHLRQLLMRFATYVGASPYLAPATLSVIAHVELTGGVWYPIGGIYRIAEALERLALELGVEIRTNTSVRRIHVTNGTVSGVEIEDGELIPASAVIANVDVTTTYRQLLPPGTLSPQLLAAYSKQPTSCSGFAMLLGVEREHPQLAHHNIFFSSNYYQEFKDIFDEGVLPRQPTVYVAITSKSDPTHAPDGCENWFVLVNAPPLALSHSSDHEGHFNRQEELHNYGDHVLATLASFGLDIKDKITHRQLITPESIATKTGAWRGALYGISNNSALNAFQRPHNRSPYVKGLYFAGGATHPGGGVPMVTLSGQLAAKMLLQDRQSANPKATPTI